MPIFGRTVILDIGQAGAPGKRYSENRVAFRVEHKKGTVASSATIQLWNPLPATTAILDAGPMPTARLLVGYGDALAPQKPTIPRQIFLGDITKNGVQITKQGADRILTLTCKDGGRKYQTSVNLTFATPVNFAQVISAIAAQILLPIGTIPPTFAGFVLPHGGAFIGSTRKIFNRIAKATNSEWTVRDGVLYFVPRGTPAPGLAPVFSAKRGNLIGSITKKDKGSVEVKALIDAGLRPGGTFIVEGNSPTTGLPTTGTYIAGDVTFIGDSGFDTPFYVQTIGHLPGVT